MQETPIVFHTGPMGSGKTSALLIALYRAAEESKKVTCLQSALNTRDKGWIKARSKLRRKATIVETNFTRAELLKLVNKADVVGIDEVHLFRNIIVEVLFDLYKDGKQIVVAGIDTDYRGRPLNTPKKLLHLPEVIIERHTAICAECGKRNAHRSQRLRDGKPVSINDPIVLIDGSDKGVTYRAVCANHHVLLR